MKYPIATVPVPNNLETMLMTGVIPKIAQHGLCMFMCISSYLRFNSHMLHVLIYCLRYISLYIWMMSGVLVNVPAPWGIWHM